jgi:cytochrome c biogenesis protein CcdA
MTNTSHGILAEFLVGSALGVLASPCREDGPLPLWHL